MVCRKVLTHLLTLTSNDYSVTYISQITTNSCSLFAKKIVE